MVELKSDGRLLAELGKRTGSSPALDWIDEPLEPTEVTLWGALSDEHKLVCVGLYHGKKVYIEA